MDSRVVYKAQTVFPLLMVPNPNGGGPSHWPELPDHIRMPHEQIDRTRRAAIRRMCNELAWRHVKVSRSLRCSRRSIRRVCKNEHGDDLEEDTEYLKEWDATVPNNDSFHDASVRALSRTGQVLTYTHARGRATTEHGDRDPLKLATSSEKSEYLRNEDSKYEDLGSECDVPVERRVPAGLLRHEAAPYVRTSSSPNIVLRTRHRLNTAMSMGQPEGLRIKRGTGSVSNSTASVEADQEEDTSVSHPLTPSASNNSESSLSRSLSPLSPLSPSVSPRSLSPISPPPRPEQREYLSPFGLGTSDPQSESATDARPQGRRTTPDVSGGRSVVPTHPRIDNPKAKGGTLHASILSDHTAGGEQPASSQRHIQPANPATGACEPSIAKGTTADGPKVRAEPSRSWDANGGAEPRITETKPPLLPLPRTSRASISHPLPTARKTVSQLPRRPVWSLRQLSPSISPSSSIIILDDLPSSPQPPHPRRTLELTLSRRALPSRLSSFIDRTHSETKQPPRRPSPRPPESPPVVQPRVSDVGRQASLTKRKHTLSEDGVRIDEQHSGEQEPKRAKLLASDASKPLIQTSDSVVPRPPRSSADAPAQPEALTADSQVGGSMPDCRLEFVPTSLPIDHGRYASPKDISFMDAERPQPHSNAAITAMIPLVAPSANISQQSAPSMNGADQNRGAPSLCYVASATSASKVSAPSSSRSSSHLDQPNSSSRVPSSETVETAPSSAVVGDGVGLAGSQQASVGGSHGLAQTAPSNPQPNTLAGIDPDVIRYVESLGLPAEVYAGKLELVGLKNATILNATKNFVPESRKDKLEEDLQKLAGLTVAESMILISGLRRSASGS